MEIFNSWYERGQIQLIFGPMFSGKTSELMRRIKRFQMAKHECLVVKYAKDIRYDSSDLIMTHDRVSITATPATLLESLKPRAKLCSVIGIDEGQFFPDIVSFAEEMANQGKVVIVAALDGSFKRIGFNDILQLVPLAEHVIKLTAVCMICNQMASYTKRKGKETQLEIIGGEDKYMAVCRKCYFNDIEIENSENDSNLANLKFEI